MKKRETESDAKQGWKKRPAPYEKVFNDNELEELEQEFIDTYTKSEKKPILMLLRLYLRYWKEILFSQFLYFIQSSPLMLFPIVAGVIVDYVVHPEQSHGALTGTQYVMLMVAILVFLLIINIPMTILRAKYQSIVLRRVEAGLRGAMVRKLQQLSITFHKEMQSGRIHSKIIRDVETIQALSSQLFSSVPAVLLNMVTAIVVVFLKNKLVLVFFLLCVPAAVLITRAFRNKIGASNKDFRLNLEATSADLQDMVEMTELTRAHALENKEVRKINKELKKVAASGYHVDIVNNQFGAFTWVTFQIFQLLCLIFTSVLAVKGFGVEVGDITIYQSYFVQLIGYVSSLINLMPIITKGIDSISSVGEILRSTDIENNNGKFKPKELRGEYEFRNVSFSYEEGQSLLRSLDLKVKAGETIALVGESGCGKTTTMNLVLGFNFPTGGQLLVDGHDITDIDLHAYRSHIAIVPQNSVLFTGTIRENITYGVTSITDEQLAEVLRAARLTELIDSLPEGLDTMLTEHGSNLSGGQRQRISIARAIIRNPSVIIFDEATSALDSVSEREIQKAIDNLTREHTTFIVAHRLSTIRNADRIAVLKDGRCVEIGTFDELMAKKGVFYEMQNIQ